MDSTSDTPLTPQGETESETITELPDSIPASSPSTPTGPEEAPLEDSRFTTGQVLRFVRVRFPGNNRSFAFYLEEGTDYPSGQKVLAMSDRGLAVGYVNSFSYEMRFHRGLLPIQSIIRVATEEDVQVERDNFRQEKLLQEACYKHIDSNKLDMQITHVELAQNGKKAVIQFTAPTRVDFRGLVHDLVNDLKMRVELRQVSVRDRSAAVGGIGPCGRELCCSSFLAKYGNVGIKLAKNQDLSLNSSKINGVCGQLKCCLTYEDEVYQVKRKRIPRENALVKTKDGNQGKVVRIHILEEQFETISREGVIRRYVAEMWDGPAEGLEVPRYFENGITDNSKTVIGLDELAARETKEMETDLKEAKVRAKDWVDGIFAELFGDKTLDFSLPEITEPDNPNARHVMIMDEEELAYTPPEDEMLDDDDDGDEDGSNEDDESPEGSPVDEMLSPNLLPRLQEPPAERAPMRPQNRADQRPEQRPQRHTQPENRNEHRHVPPQGDRHPPERAPGSGQGRRRRRGGRGGGGRGGQGPQGGGNGQRPPRS